MIRFIRCALFCLISIAVGVTLVAAESQKWPVNTNIDFSDGFGEFRQGHFHTGVDLRTGGKIGVGVHAPVNGYLYRVKMSYYGSGKALYLMGDDGFIYVFYHLSKFHDKIASFVTDAQIADKRYYQDVYLPKDSIRFNRGEIIAYSGSTGIGAPHLHFEKRSPENVPLNPLTHGFKVKDNTPPIFERIFFKQTDDYSLFDNGEREIIFDVSKSSQSKRYIIDTLLYFNRPFGLMTDCFDMMRPDGMKQTVYKFQVYVDDELYYEVKFDSLDFKNTRSVESVYEYKQAVEKEDHVRALYLKKGNFYKGSNGVNGFKGIIGNNLLSLGKHRVKIKATDASNNSSSLEFDFLWGPQEYIYTLDSTTTVELKYHSFFFTPIENYEAFAIDSIVPFLNRGNVWGRLSKGVITVDETGRVVCQVEGYAIDKSVIRLVAYSGKNGVIKDNIFNGIHLKGKPYVKFEHKVVDDGIIVQIKGKVRTGCTSRIELYYQGKLLGTEYPQFHTMITHYAFIPPKPEYKMIDQIGVSLSKDTSFLISAIDSVRIFAIGYDDVEEIVINNMFSLKFGKEYFHKPRFIEIKEKMLSGNTTRYMASKVLQILPDAFICKENFEIVCKLRGTGKWNAYTGICWLDIKKDKWIWLDTEFDNQVLTAKSTGGGYFAAITDYDPPVISKANYLSGRTYQNVSRPIIFSLVDLLSGIDDDLDITVKLDSKWQIVEYDPESDLCKVELLESLSYGKHHLGIIITDKAGNIGEQYMTFTVKKGKKSFKRK